MGRVHIHRISLELIEGGNYKIRAIGEEKVVREVGIETQPPSCSWGLLLLIEGDAKGWDMGDIPPCLVRCSHCQEGIKTGGSPIEPLSDI
jgi:hypothetical protein